MAATFFTDEQKAAQARSYEDMLVTLYLSGLPMPQADLREAERLILAKAGRDRKTARILRNRAAALAKSETA